MTCSAPLHTLFTRQTLDETLSSSDQASSSLSPKWTLWATTPPHPKSGVRQPLTTRFNSSLFRYWVHADERALLDDILREGRRPDVSSEEEAQSLSTWHRRRLLLHQEEKELATRPVLPWHVPLHGCCA